jgi:hypothetical protein
VPKQPEPGSKLQEQLRPKRPEWQQQEQRQEQQRPESKQQGPG